MLNTGNSLQIYKGTIFLIQQTRCNMAVCKYFVFTRYSVGVNEYRIFTRWGLGVLVYDNGLEMLFVSCNVTLKSHYNPVSYKQSPSMNFIQYTINIKQILGGNPIHSAYGETASVKCTCLPSETVNFQSLLDQAVC